MLISKQNFDSSKALNSKTSSRPCIITIHPYNLNYKVRQRLIKIKNHGLAAAIAERREGIEPKRKK